MRNNDTVRSLVIASNYRVPDPTRVWPLLQRRKSALSRMCSVGVRALGGLDGAVYGAFASTRAPARAVFTDL